MTRKIITVITAVTGDRIVIGEAEFNHAKKVHFHMLPDDILLELIERVLKDPNKIFEQKRLHQYHLFYRLDKQTYLVVIVKKLPSGNYFSSIYPTGSTARNVHKHLKEIKL